MSGGLGLLYARYQRASSLGWAYLYPYTHPEKASISRSICKNHHIEMSAVLHLTCTAHQLPYRLTVSAHCVPSPFTRSSVYALSYAMYPFSSFLLGPEMRLAPSDCCQDKPMLRLHANPNSYPISLYW
jgi:hypothetical protein